MQTSAAGSSRFFATGATRCGGFTLLELLVVLVIVAMATVGVGLALPDPASGQLESESQRLAALFESARAQSRASGVAVRWTVTAEGFRFEGVAEGALPSRWLGTETRALTSSPVVLGPEPLIGPQAVDVTLASRPDLRVRVGTDGLHPFAIVRGTP